jgi:hypothetical protein
VQLPSWPTTPPTHGAIVLREFTVQDAHLAAELGEDPYVPLIGSLPAHPTPQQALEWIHRQRGRLAEGTGLSFAIADADSGNAVGAIGCGCRTCRQAARRRATRFHLRSAAAASRPARCRR